MKTLATLLLVALVTSHAVAQRTLIHRIDMSRSNEPYHVTAILLDSGWEFWAFASTRSELLDLEVGRLYPLGKKLLVGGYATYWPDSKEWFGIPWVSYNDSVAGGQLNVNLAAYIPLNGGPRILFSDETTLVWQSKTFNYGVVVSYWKFGDDTATIRLGSTFRFAVGKTTNLKINYQPLFLAGQGQPNWRIELSQRF